MTTRARGESNPSSRQTPIVKHRVDDEAPILFSKQPLGIEAFRVEGCVDRASVRAHWDGRWLVVSKTLYRHAMVAVAVEAAFAEAGIGVGRGSPDELSPEELMLALVTCCDQLHVAEYELKGHRRVFGALR
jgi:hypothetical protein